MNNFEQGGVVEVMGNYTVGEQGLEYIIPRKWFDYIGFVASFLCAIHCILTPIIIVTLPVIGSYFVVGNQVEIIFVLTSILLAFFSVCWGYKLHKKHQLFLFLFVSSLFLGSGVYLYHGTVRGLILLGIGGLLLGITHFINLSLCQSCNHC